MKESEEHAAESEADTNADAAAVAETGADAGADTGADTAAVTETAADAAATTETKTEAATDTETAADTEAAAESAPEAAEAPPEPAAPPAIAGIAPASALAGQGASVSLIGEGFAEACVVRLGDVDLVSKRMSASRVEALVPAQPVGDITLVLANPDGQTASVSMHFEEAPAISGVAPPAGTTRGGDTLTITGRRFAPGCVVDVGDARATEVTFEDEGRLRAIAPACDAPGPVDVVVTNPSGLSHRAPGAFFYRRPAPRIDAISPAEGPSAGGTRISVRGDDFQQGCTALVCGLPAQVTFKGRDEIELVTPEVPRDGPADVRVMNPDDQSATAEKAFHYRAALLPPALVEVSPRSGPQAGGTTVSLLGEHFADPVRVRFGGITVTAQFLTHKEISAVTPAYDTAGEVAVDVVNPDGAIASIEAAFTYEARPAPAIASVHPANGPTIGGTKIVIEGEHFDASAVVYVGREKAGSVAVKSATEIHAVTPPRKADGVADVEVSVPGVPKAVKKNAFRYDAVPAPSISSVAPNRGRVAGGTELTIEGKNFLRETAVLIGGKPVKSIKYVDKSTIEVKTPPGVDDKLVDVAVRNPDGREAVQKRAFMYDPRYR